MELTSNFRINIDLFELTIFATNFDLQTADKAIKGCMKQALRYFGPFPAKRRLEMIDNLVFISENLTLPKWNRLKSPTHFGGHCAVEIKRGNCFLNHSCLTHAECSGAQSCWIVHGLRPKCLSSQYFNTVFKTFSR